MGNFFQAMGTGQTVCNYGTLSLVRCVISHFDQKPRFDRSDTDMECWEYTIGVTGYLRGDLQTTDDAGPKQVINDSEAENVLGQGAAVNYEQLRWRLYPRQTFVLATGCASDDVNSGGIVLIADAANAGFVTTPTALENSTSGLSNIDVNDGPRCTRFMIEHVGADNVWKVNAMFRVCLTQCEDDGTTGNKTGILSHRWSSIDALDRNLRVRRSYRGLLVLATAQFSPHWFRSLVVPRLQPGFRRESMTFAANENGKALQYEIVDQAVDTAAPSPARFWSGEHTEVMLREDTKSAGMMTLRLEADSTVAKVDLLTLGLYCITAKLLGVQPGANQTAQADLSEIAITEYIGDVNAITISAKSSRIIGTTDNILGPFLDNFVRDIQGSDLPTFAGAYNPTISRALGVQIPSSTRVRKR